jgi:hypothetical protein
MSLPTRIGKQRLRISACVLLGGKARYPTPIPTQKAQDMIERLREITPMRLAAGEAA